MVTKEKKHSTKYSCPHIMTVKHEIGDFKTKTIKGRRYDYFDVEKVVENEERCLGNEYVVVNPHPFDTTSGLDPNLVLIKCTTCGKESYLLPAREVND